MTEPVSARPKLRWWMLLLAGAIGGVGVASIINYMSVVLPLLLVCVF